MIKAFLSHSSKDKDYYVRKVANWLGKDNIIYDEFTFEEGEKPLDEIIKGLEQTEIFVLFLSENALKSDWVIKEICEAKIKLESNDIDKFFPIIIEDGLTYDDPRIPQWLRDNYNLKPIKRAEVAARRIHKKLRELSWSKHPELKKRQNIFVGRNDKQEEFEERIHDFDREKPTVIIASGVSGVGRRTFLSRALFKTNITDSRHKPSAIILDRNVSIEDFILKLNDLGLIDIGKDVLSLASKTIDEKISIIHKIMKASYESKEIIFMVDEGCLVNYKREISDWFIKTINSYEGSNLPVFCLASRYKVHFKSRPRNNKFYFIELNELNPNERKRLLTQLLELYKVKLDANDFNDIYELLFGFPSQVMYAVDLVREDNITNISDKLPVLAEYNSDKAAVLLSQYEGNEVELDFIRLLAQFEVISLDFIFSIVDEEIYYPILEKLASECIVELIGIDGEIVRLNDIIRDYIKRNRLYVTDEFAVEIKKQVVNIAKSDDIFERDSSEYIFTLKEMLKEGEPVNEDLLIPSHYLRCMKDLYYNKGNLDRIIELADIILQKKATLEAGVLQDIQYYLCLALAKKRDGRMLKEVQNIKGDEHTFLLGFYYRHAGRYREALDKFTAIVNARYVGARSKREIVQVYVQLEEYEKALDYAKRNYEENLGNQFHAQAYFNCMINSETPEIYKHELRKLINSLRLIDSDQSKEMADIADALYDAKVLNNKITSLDKINDCISKYPGNHYPLLAKCDIALKYYDKNVLEEGFNQLNNIITRRHFSFRTLNRYKASLLALDGNLDEALRVIDKDLNRYPQESKERIISKLKEYASH
ncbi:MAG TPA: TIR domain-containing protein [Gammaproteobacteria bacterium]|nr:TIR domain-containing protein [Gammaproteobacteria bacterium]